jgi:hypothetical protein
MSGISRQAKTYAQIALLVSNSSSTGFRSGGGWGQPL